MMTNRTDILISGFVICLFLLLPAASPAAETHSNWTELETEYTIIRYESVEILSRFQKSIQFGNGWWASTSSFNKFTEEENRQIASLKIDAVFERVQEILDMKKRFEKVSVYLFPDKETLEKNYTKTYGTPPRFRAWYEFRTNSIFLNAADCHEGLLAHELAHSIINNYLEIRPPKNTAEILARYVDAHLK